MEGDGRKQRCAWDFDRILLSTETESPIEVMTVADFALHLCFRAHQRNDGLQVVLEAAVVW